MGKIILIIPSVVKQKLKIQCLNVSYGSKLDNAQFSFW